MSSVANPADGEAVATTDEGGKYVLVVSIALVIAALDQATKIWVAADMSLYQSIPIIDGFFSITYVRNTGAAFSMLAGMPEAYRLPFFTAVAVVAGSAILYFVRTTPASEKMVLVGCGLVLGGAVGNFIDRAVYGSVVDFLDVYYGDWHWPAFNVADSSISTGVGLILLNAVLARD